MNYKEELPGNIPSTVKSKQSKSDKIDRGLNLASNRREFFKNSAGLALVGSTIFSINPLTSFLASAAGGRPGRTASLDRVVMVRFFPLPI